MFWFGSRYRDGFSDKKEEHDEEVEDDNVDDDQNSTHSGTSKEETLAVEEQSAKLSDNRDDPKPESTEGTANPTETDLPLGNNDCSATTTDAAVDQNGASSISIADRWHRPKSAKN
jgi:hypothetical protein